MEIYVANLKNIERGQAFLEKVDSCSENDMKV
jgi:hypothetical protein